jgi:hypothetical protein
MTGLLAFAGFLIAMILLVIAVWAARDRRQEAAWRREDDQADANVRGRHRAPRGAVVVPRPPTGGTPPWDFQAAPVLEPATVISGPPEPEPEAYWLAAGTISDGQVRTVRVEVLPPPVEALLGHSTTDAAVESMSAGWHSVESIFNGHHVRQVRALTDGAS